MRVATTVPKNNLQLVPDAARHVESSGFDSIRMMENSNNPFLSLAVAATVTERVELMTGIAIAFARTPMAVAGMSHDLQLASGGRFKLGLGTQVKGHNERRFSVPWTPPAPRMREYIEVLRAIWRTYKSADGADHRRGRGACNAASGRVSLRRSAVASLLYAEICRGSRAPQTGGGLGEK